MEDRMRQLILDFKFRKQLTLIEDLTDLLEGAVKQDPDWHRIDVIIPVPMNWYRRLSRGFNQSALLAKELGRRICRRVDTNSLLRHPIKGMFLHQSRSNKDERETNLKGLFLVRHPEMLRGRTVLLVDDVMTTGSTLSECTRMLLSAGAHAVFCATVARAEMRMS